LPALVSSSVQGWAPGTFGHAVLRLAGIRRSAEIDERAPLFVDDEGMHGVVARERQAATR